MDRSHSLESGSYGKGSDGEPEAAFGKSLPIHQRHLSPHPESQATISDPSPVGLWTPSLVSEKSVAFAIILTMLWHVDSTTCDRLHLCRGQNSTSTFPLSSVTGKADKQCRHSFTPKFASFSTFKAC